jgi:HSP20 family protein
MSTTGTTTRTPAVNVFENPSEVVVLAAIPGVEPEDITVRLDANRLVVRTQERGEDATKKYLVKEWSYGPYEREIELATPVNAQSANLSYGNGVLTVVLPRAPDFVAATLALPKTGGARGTRQGH